MPSSKHVRTLALAFFVLSGCGKNADHPADAGRDATGPAACTAAGGKCVLGGSGCARIGPQNCDPDRNPGGAVCCLDPAFLACSEGKTSPIKASDYDQTCQKDSDCIGIGEGDGCDCEVLCQNAAINVADEPKWRTDLEQTPAHAMTCHCPAAPVPCCLDQRCSSDLLQCQPHTSDETDAGR